MAFVPAENVALLELVYLWSDQIVENTLYFQTESAMSVSDMALLGNALIDWWNAGAFHWTNVNVSLQEVKVTDLTTDTAPSITVATDLPVFGEVTGDPLPNNCSIAVSFRTAGRGRSARGRNYIVGLSEASVNGNVVSSTVQGQIRTAYQNLNSDLSAAVPGQWVVVSRFHDHAPRVTALVQPVVSALLTDGFIDSQRRRLPGRGR